MDLKLGIQGEASAVVTEEKTAAAVGSGDLPVFATPYLAAMMEQAAQMSIAPYLEEGSSSVGTCLNIQHIAATPVGMRVCAKSKLEQIDGRRLLFQVEAYDEAEKIGEGTHERVIIKKEKFLLKAEEKK